MSALKMTSEEEMEMFGNALIEYDLHGRPINKPKKWYNGVAANVNDLGETDLELSDE